MASLNPHDAAWPAEIFDWALESVSSSLKPDVVLVHVRESQLQPSFERAWISPQLNGWRDREHLSAALDVAYGLVLDQRPATQMLVGETPVAIAAARVQVERGIAFLVVGSRLRDFPSEAERAMLQSVAEAVATKLNATYANHIAAQDSDAFHGQPQVSTDARDLKVIIDTIPALAWSAAPKRNPAFFNKHYLEYLGMSAKHAGERWTDAIHPDDHTALMKAWQAIVASEKAGESEARLRRHDGEYRWFLFRANPLRDESGKITQWYGVNTDIEERKRAEADLSRVNRHLTEAQRLSQTGSFTLDLVHDQHTWSDEFYRICDFELRSEVTTQRLRGIVHPEDRVAFDSAIQRAADGTDTDLIFRIVTAKGVLKHLHGFAHRVQHESDRPVFLGAVQDVTASKLAEESLSKARSELAHVARAATLSALTASIAHEVNQPLSGILTNAGTCLRLLNADTPNVSDASEAARLIIRDGNRAANVIQRLRGLFAKKEFALESIDLSEVTLEVLALAHGEMQRNRIVILQDLAANLPMVTGDRIQLQQVILNLLRNAADAMMDVSDRQRHLFVQTARTHSDQIQLVVRDVGIGFDPQNAERMFEAFSTTKKNGMGIGLSISRSIVEQHHGRLWAEQNLHGPGSTFYFSLPATI